MKHKALLLVKVAIRLLLTCLLKKFLHIDDGTLQVIIETNIFYYRRFKPFIVYTIRMTLYLVLISFQIYIVLPCEILLVRLLLQSKPYLS